MESVPPADVKSSDAYLDENAERFEPNRAVLPAPNEAEFRSNMLALARELGLIRIGYARAEPFDEAGQRFKHWLGQGHAGTMNYLAELGDRHLPGRLLRNARSLVVVAAGVPTPSAPSLAEQRDDENSDLHSDGAISGTVADYALGLDYHIALRSRLRRIGQGLADWSGRGVWTRACIDTAPILEREAARRAGLGFIAKSTMLIVPGIGPRVLLATLVTDLDLSPGEPIESRCGRCTACLDACPTQAFVGPYQLDARRCLSYLTIEHQGEFPRELRSAAQNRVIGCDVCQAVCPYDRIDASQVSSADAAPRAHLVRPDLIRWLEMTSTDYRRLAKRTALRRVTRTQLMRNAAIALGNCKSDIAVVPLSRAVAESPSPIVRAHAAWALGQLGTTQAEQMLLAAMATETDAAVRTEIDLALNQLRSPSDRPRAALPGCGSTT